MALKTFKKTAYCLLALLVFSSSALAEKPSIAILAPSSNQELSTVFELIIDGIKQSTPQFTKDIQLLTDDNQDKIKQWLTSHEFQAVVTIGNKTTDFANTLPITFPVVTTGTLFSNNKSHSGVSLSIADDALKNTLRHYLPHIKKLHIGDEGDNIIWFTTDLSSPQLIRQKIGHEQKSIVQFLWKTINQVDPKTEAVWINNNIEHIFLYKLSERAWERNVTLISNNISHLESGTLLAIYPDFKGMGQRTGELLTTIIKQNKPGSLRLEPLSAIHRGINLRTAQHLGVEIPSAMENDFRVIIK